MSSALVSEVKVFDDVWRRKHILHATIVIQAVHTYFYKCKTRKLSYRKDHRAMLYIGALKIFESLSTPTATFPEIFNGLLFRSIL